MVLLVILIKTDFSLNTKQPGTFTDFLRVAFKNVLEPIARFLNCTGIHPNVVTVIGMVGHVLAAWFVIQGQITLGGIVTLIMAPIDAIDGTMARLRGHASVFGAFVDSVTDRYSETFIFGGLLVYYALQNNPTGVILAFLSITGSMMVSYVRTRAESLGFESKIGLLSRVERYLILIPSLILNVPMTGLWILAIFTHITALQRVFYVRRNYYLKVNQERNEEG